MSYLRSSPVHTDLIQRSDPAIDAYRMRVSSAMSADAAKLQSVALADLSCLPRCGLKGPGAAAWLQSQAIAIPANPNGWMALPGGGVVARLGRSEFFLEDEFQGSTARQVRAALGAGIEGVYPVIRQDAGIALLGPRSNELLVQTCNVDFESIEAAEAVMTQMVGVSVLVIRRDRGSMRCHRLWCDPTFAPYLWQTLSGIAAELGGGVVGTEGLLE